MAQHPCRSCGACCAFFRVEFYWREANVEDTPSAVPLELTEDLGGLGKVGQTRCMKGTNGKSPLRCIALEGRIGEQVGCAIYALRASPCRRFLASYENGEPNFRCDQARAHYGLRALSPRDWPVNGLALHAR